VRDLPKSRPRCCSCLHGGATARPFVTHSNALDIDLYLRIAPELYLKRAVVGGIERVFEINRNFRNEGIDSSHSPEFAMLEAYEAYGSYDTIAELTQLLVTSSAQAVYGSTVVRHADGSEHDLGGKWREVTLHEGRFRGARRGGNAGHAGRRAAWLCRLARGPAQGQRLSW